MRLELKEWFYTNKINLLYESLYNNKTAIVSGRAKWFSLKGIVVKEGLNGNNTRYGIWRYYTESGVFKNKKYWL